MAGADSLRSPHPHTDGSSTCVAHFHGRRWTWVLSRAVGHHAPVLDLLHLPDTAFVCCPGAWDGSGRILASKFIAENGMGEIQSIQDSTCAVRARNKHDFHREVTFVTQNHIDMDKNSPIM